MIIKDYLTNDYPLLELNDHLSLAKEMAQDFGFTHIFLENDGYFLGSLDTENLITEPNTPLSEWKNQLEKFTISQEQYLIEAIKIFHQFPTNVIPVTDAFGKYLGYISYDDVVNELSHYHFFSENGVILNLQTCQNKYSMVEISQIIEGYNAHIFGSLTYNIDEDQIGILIKISDRNTDIIEQELERFGYLILHRHYKKEKEEMLKSRFDFLKKYIES